ncbi:MAG TPA: hypothetical protein VIP77_01445 [Jiangellaceae bacterium]
MPAVVGTSAVTGSAAPAGQPAFPAPLRDLDKPGLAIAAEGRRQRPGPPVTFFEAVATRW